LNQHDTLTSAVIHFHGMHQRVIRAGHQLELRHNEVGGFPRRA